MDKYKRSDIAGVERENERNENYNSKVNPQIDCERTGENYHVLKQDGSYLKYINKRIKEISQKRKLKDDAVLMCSFILGSDREFFEGMTQEQQREFFYDCAVFFAERYGKENITSAVVHVDETTPHMHLNLMPVFENRLCAKKLFDRVELRSLQSEFHEKVGKKWNLQRGKIGSKAEHLDTVAFKLKKMKEEAIAAVLQKSEAEATIAKAERVQKEAEPVRELLEDYEKAKSEIIPFSGKKKDEQIIALRTKNEQLEREAKIKSKDQEYLYRQLQETTRRNKGEDTAYKMVSDILSAYPDEFDALLKKARTKKNPPKPFKSNGNYRGGK